MSDNKDARPVTITLPLATLRAILNMEAIILSDGSLANGTDRWKMGDRDVGKEFVNTLSGWGAHLSDRDISPLEVINNAIQDATT